MEINRFWKLFCKNEAIFSGEMRSGRHRAVFESVDQLLKSCGLDICFDLTTSDHACILIFSPEGSSEDANRIDSLMRYAPNLRDWEFLGRRPKKELNDAAAIVRSMYLIDPLKLMYKIRITKDSKTVYMLIPLCFDISPEESAGMIDTFLWHSIGEATIMENNIRGEIVRTDDHTGNTISAVEMVNGIQQACDLCRGR